MQKGVIYLAGPMTGRENLNFSAFDRLAEELEDRGWAVHNPAMSFNRSKIMTYELYMSAAINLLLQSEAIALMDGWRNSRGAKLEALIAQRMNLPFYQAETGEPMEVETFEIDAPEVIRVGREPKDYPFFHDLVDLAEELADHEHGITATHVRRAAIRRGILEGDLTTGATEEDMSILSHIMRAAGLETRGEYRRSDLPITHGNLQAVWFAPERVPQSA